jgi:hypothetical protein
LCEIQLRPLPCLFPANQQKINKKPVVGKASSIKLKAAVVKKPVDLFVTRVCPDAVESDVIDIVKMALDTSPDVIDMDCVKCEKLRTKFDSYASFHITICVDTIVLKNVVQLLMSGEIWPDGVLIRRFFVSKNG